MYKYIEINTGIGEVLVVWDEDIDILKQIILPDSETGKVNKNDISHHGVIYEDHPKSNIRSFTSKIKNAILGKEVDFIFDYLDLSELTAFQKAVLLKQRIIPHGMVTSYKQLATLIGHPRSARPVANVLSRNPFPIVIPCHRTVRSDWHIGGYCGANNNPIKEYILKNEGITFKNETVINKCRYTSSKIKQREKFVVKN